MIASQIGMDTLSCTLVVVLVHFVSLVSLSAHAAPTDLQILMTPKNMSQADLIQRNHLIRLWPLDSINKSTNRLDIEDSVFGIKNQKTLSRSAGVKSLTCQQKSYAYFDHGAIISNESFLIQDLIKNSKQNFLQRSDNYLRRKIVFINTKTDMDQMLEPYAQLHSNQLIKDISVPENQKAIENSTSLVHVSKDRKDRWAVESSNYTIGGWFKPSSNRDKGVSLFTKYFKNIKSENSVKEWEIFYSGNTIYFHVYHDYQIGAESKYLGAFEAREFREQNRLFYEPTEFYNDLVEKQASQTQTQAPASGQPRQLVKIFVDIPIAHKNAKPIPEPVVDQPPANPIVIINPPTPPIPPGVIPFPPRVTEPIRIGYGATGKEYTLGFDFKNFWWGVNSFLGGCYGCIQGGVDHDVWHFFAVSVKLDDPLGPYVDLTIIRDANERKFGAKATLSSNFRTARFELNRQLSSRPINSVITHSFLTENQCGSDENCTVSELEIGSTDNNRPYSGFMRGVFISKKALNQTSLIEMAAEFNPQDTNLCTYLKP
jgi:hypothetical protein